MIYKLFNRTRLGILCYFTQHESGRLDDFVRFMNRPDRGNVHKDLQKLCELEVLERRQDGGRVSYSLHSDLEGWEAMKRALQHESVMGMFE